MLKVCAIVVLVVLLSFPFALRADAFLVVFFHTKQGTPYSIENPSQFLSQRSLERRQKFSIPIDSTDLPVNPALLDSLIRHGIADKILYTSRWLNCAVVVPSVGFWRRRHSCIKSTFFGRINNNYVDDFALLDELPEKSLVDNSLTENQLTEIGISKLHAMGLTGKGLLVAVIDAGFRALDKLNVFDSLRNQQRIVAVRDFVEFNNSVYGSHSHGTSVMALMAGNLPGKYIGSAPDASYVLIRTEDVATETRLEEYNWLAAAEFADSLGVDLINSSLGYNKFDNPDENYSINDLTGDVAICSRAAGMAAAKGIVVISSAGNDGNTDWRYLDFPADHPDVIAVGATDSTGTLWSGSSIGMPFHAYKPDFVARGVDIWVPSTYTSGFYRGNGTSFSAPIFAGGMACLMQYFSSKNLQQLRQALQETASNANLPNNLSGYGLPDFHAAFYNLLDIEKPTNASFTINKLGFNRAESLLEIDVISSVNNKVLIEVFDSLGRSLQSIENEITPEMPTRFSIRFAIPVLPQMVVVVFRGVKGNPAVSKLMLY